jgi:hypothetical protein
MAGNKRVKVLVGDYLQSALRNRFAKAYSRPDPRWWSQVAHDRSSPDSAHEPAQVLRFRPRHRADHLPLRGSAIKPDENESFDDLARYERDADEVDDPHRMVMNVIALAVVALLVGFGVWIADTIALMEKDQDCMLQGLANCEPIEMPAPPNQQ